MEQRYVRLALLAVFCILMAVDPRTVWFASIIATGILTGWSYGEKYIQTEA